MLKERMDAFIAAAERMHLAEYVRFESDRKRRLLDAFWRGVVRGVGVTVGIAVLGGIIVWLLQRIAESSVPAIGDFIAKIVKLVQLRIE